MEKESTVYVLQELPGTRLGRPKYNIIGAQKYGKLKVLYLHTFLVCQRRRRNSFAGLLRSWVERGTWRHVISAAASQHVAAHQI